MRDHLDWLLAKLSPRKYELSRVQSCDGLHMSVQGVWWSKYGYGGPVISPEQLGAMADLNLEFSISFGYFGTKV
jgi:hypothetical protein